MSRPFVEVDRDLQAVIAEVEGDPYRHLWAGFLLNPLAQQAVSDTPDAYADRIDEARVILTDKLTRDGRTPADIEDLLTRLTVLHAEWLATTSEE